MEPVHILLGQDATFDQVVHQGIAGKGALPQASPVMLVTKDHGTETKRAIAVLAFDVQLPDGTILTAQAVLSARLLTAALAAVRGRYGDDGFAPDTGSH